MNRKSIREGSYRWNEKKVNCRVLASLPQPWYSSAHRHTFIPAADRNGIVAGKRPLADCGWKTNLDAQTETSFILSYIASRTTASSQPLSLFPFLSAAGMTVFEHTVFEHTASIQARSQYSNTQPVFKPTATLLDCSRQLPSG